MDLITQIATILMAAAFIWGTFWIQRKHNKLSVKPQLNIFYDYNTDGSSLVSSVKYYLVNNGIGPAVIKKIRFFDESGWRLYIIESEESDPFHDSEPGEEVKTLMQKYVGTIFRRDGRCPNIQEAGNISHFTKNYHLPAKEKILLMHVYFPKIVMNINTLSVYPGYDLLSPEEFSLYLNKGTIKINYESIYGDCFELNSQNALDNLSIDYSSGRHGE